MESLGAKFVAVEDEEFKQAETAGGYAKEMSKEYQAKQAALVAEHIKKQDIVITTALIPGRPAPRLISKEMVASMRPGSVIVDLAVERGGNCELAKPGEVVEVGGVKIVGHLNVPGRIAASASSLYAKNLFAFLEILVDKDSKALGDQMGRRDREGDGAHPRRRGDSSEFCPQERGVTAHCGPRAPPSQRDVRSDAAIVRRCLLHWLQVLARSVNAGGPLAGMRGGST